MTPEQRHFAAFQARVRPAAALKKPRASSPSPATRAAATAGLAGWLRAFLACLTDLSGWGAHVAEPALRPCRSARSRRSACGTALTPPPGRCGPAATTLRARVRRCACRLCLLAVVCLACWPPSAVGRVPAWLATCLLQGHGSPHPSPPAHTLPLPLLAAPWMAAPCSRHPRLRALRLAPPV